MSTRPPVAAHTTVPRRVTTALLTLALVAAGAGSAVAQAADGPFGDWRPDAGDKSLAFQLPSGGGTGLALWWHRARGRATGLELAVAGNASMRLGGSDPDRPGR